MFRNYLITALRNVTRHKLYSFINIAGLTVGLACAIFIILFVRDELSYDKWIPDSENLYRVESTFYLQGRDPQFFSVTPFPVTPTMQAEIPDVAAQTHLIPENMTAQVGDRQFPVIVNAVDPNFLQVVKLPLIEGDPAAVLRQPESLVLSQATAKRFFGAGNPLGRTVLLAGTHSLVVTGIMRDLPHNTHLSIDLMMPNTSSADTMGPPDSPEKHQWLNIHGWGYVKLAPGADPALVAEKLKPMLDRHMSRPFNMDIRGSDALHLHLTAFRRIHLSPFGDSEAGRWPMVYGFAAIAALIVMIASINYMNLATARAMARAREVSLRKVMGATRSQLIVQFMGESLVLALIALILAVVAVELLLPQFGTLIGRPIVYGITGDWPLTFAIMAVALLVGLVGGVYPAFVLSGFRPAASLGTNASNRGGSGLLRAALVVMQFAISIGLGIAVIVIFAQIGYSRRIDIGFDRHNLLVINSAGPLAPSSRSSITKALAADPAIAGAAQSDMVPFDGGITVANLTLPESGQQFVVRHVEIDPDFIHVYGMKLLAGRDLSRDRGADIFRDSDDRNPNPGANILIDEAAARQFGYTAASAVGHSVLTTQDKRRLTIVGVVGNANYDGLEMGMQPFFYEYYPPRLGTISVRIKPGRTREALAAVDRIWHQFAPTVAIQRGFQDANFDRYFIDDEREGKIFAIFVGIAIFIACLGLFGLAAFSTERRTREIGIRKTFGAKTKDIVLMLLWQFSIPVLIANLIAWPVAYYYLHGWLEGYAYRVSLNPLYFLGAGGAALVIAWATVIVHAAHVARANPVHALRYE